MKIIAGPTIHQDTGFLDIKVRGTDKELRDLNGVLELVRAPVKKLGYDPDGRAGISKPESYGVILRDKTLWFYTRL